MASSMVVIWAILFVSVASAGAARMMPRAPANLNIHNNCTGNDNEVVPKEVAEGDGDGGSGVGLNDQKNLLPISGGMGAGMGGYGEVTGPNIPFLGRVGGGMRSGFGMGNGFGFGGGTGVGTGAGISGGLGGEPGSGFGGSSGGLGSGFGGASPGGLTGGFGGALPGGLGGGFGSGLPSGFGGGNSVMGGGFPSPFP